MSGDTRTGSIPVCGIGQESLEDRVYGIPEIFFILEIRYSGRLAPLSRPLGSVVCN